jgi:hypothetical protein
VSDPLSAQQIVLRLSGGVAHAMAVPVGVSLSTMVGRAARKRLVFGRLVRAFAFTHFPGRTGPRFSRNCRSTSESSYVHFS